MLPIDPADGQGSVIPAPPPRDRPRLPDILPAQAMADGGTIIRPGAVAWGGRRDARDIGSSSCEAIERALAVTGRDPGRLSGLLAELADSRLWVPLPVRHRPFTDGTAIRLPVVGFDETDFVPCFTSVQRLTAWLDAPSAVPGEQPAPAGRRWQRAGDTRVLPHVVLPAAGLARRLPPGLGLALNPGSAPGLPLYPECVSYLARTTPAAAGDMPPPASTPRASEVPPGSAPAELGPPPVEPAALLRAASATLGTVSAVRAASRAWLRVRGRGEGLIIAVLLDDPASDPARLAVVAALEHAVAQVPLRVPFPVDVTFPGESAPDMIDEWMARNTRPFYTRG